MLHARIRSANVHYSEFQEFQPFVNLPPRSLNDYYQLIKKPMCLKLMIKRCRGQHGRDAATGVTDFKTWDAFEDEVSLIWQNAQTYNEDGSDMFQLADTFKVGVAAPEMRCNERS